MSVEQPPQATAEPPLPAALGYALLWLVAQGLLFPWVVDLLRLQAMPAPPLLINIDRRDHLASVGRRLARRRLFRLLDRVWQARRDTAGALNAQMLLESLLLDAVECITP